MQQGPGHIKEISGIRGEMCCTAEHRMIIGGHGTVQLFSPPSHRDSILRKIKRIKWPVLEDGGRDYLTEWTCISSCLMAGFRRSTSPSAIASFPGSTAAAILAWSSETGETGNTSRWRHRPEPVSIFSSSLAALASAPFWRRQNSNHCLWLLRIIWNTLETKRFFISNLTLVRQCFRGWKRAP